MGLKSHRQHRLCDQSSWRRYCQMFTVREPSYHAIRIVRYWSLTQPHPFRLLQITEWLLLGIAAVQELPWQTIVYSANPFPEEGPMAFATYWLSLLLSLIVLGFLGLRLPTGATPIKWVYISVQFGLILYANIYWLSPLLTPYLVVAIRGWLIFRNPGRRWIAGLTFALALSSVGILLHGFHIYSYGSYDVEINETDVEIDETFQHDSHSDIDFNSPEVEFTPFPSNEIALLVDGVTGFLFCGLVLAFVLMLVNALLAERSSRQQLTTAHQQLHRYALRIEDQATLQERNRIAREIHDAVGHNLTALRIQLENAVFFYQADPEKTETHLQTAQQLAAKALKEIRYSVSTLHSDPL